MKLGILIEKRYKILVSLFFVLYLCVGLSIFRDYGISWDEYSSRQRGVMALKYIVEGDNALINDQCRYHGTAFEILLQSIERFLNLTKDSRAVSLMRHLVTFLLFYTGVFFFYRLCKYRFRSWKVGLLGALFFILSPRIFAHSFYNPKDIPYLSMFIISMYALVRYLDKKTFSRAVFLALACAFLVDIRIFGIMVPFLAIIFFITDLFTIKTKEDRKIITGFLIYLCLFIFLTILFWPLLWKDPISHLINALKMAYPYHNNFGVLYLGDYIENIDLPWHYIPVWIIISTPVLYIFYFFIGFFVLIKLLLKNQKQSSFSKRNDFIFILWFFLPLLAVIGFRLVVYDGWRHMFFIYPAFLMISLIGLTSCFEFIKMKMSGLSYRIINAILILIVVFSLVNTARLMVKYHPYQNIYFNILAGRDMKKIKNNFPLDYWGLSYRNALEYILKNDKDKVIKIYAANGPGKQNIGILTANDRKRLVSVDNPDEAKYFLSNYRWHKEEYPYKEEYYSIKIDGARIMVVYKIN